MRTSSAQISQDTKKGKEMSEEDAKFKNPFEINDEKPQRSDDPFAPNPSLNMKGPSKSNKRLSYFNCDMLEFAFPLSTLYHLLD